VRRDHLQVAADGGFRRHAKGFHQLPRRRAVDDEGEDREPADLARHAGGEWWVVCGGRWVVGGG